MKTPDSKNRILSTKLILLSVLFLIALGERVLFDFGPNFELVTTVLVLSSFYIGKKESFWVVFLIMLFSDLVIGNTNIFIFTWSGFLIPALFMQISKNRSILSKTLGGTLAGISANLFFFIWTNFGVWLLSGMYSKSATGLLMSYINALPFLRYQVISTLIFIPFGFFVTETAIYFLKKWRLNSRFSPYFDIETN